MGCGADKIGVETRSRRLVSFRKGRPLMIHYFSTAAVIAACLTGLAMALTGPSMWTMGGGLACVLLALPEYWVSSRGI